MLKIIFGVLKIKLINMNQLKKHEVKLFYKELQNKLTDNRDNRGKIHELAFVITLMFYSIIFSDGMVL